MAADNSTPPLPLASVAVSIDEVATQLAEVEARLGRPEEREGDIDLAVKLGHTLRNMLTELFGKVYFVEQLATVSHLRTTELARCVVAVAVAEKTVDEKDGGEREAS